MCESRPLDEDDSTRRRAQALRLGQVDERGLVPCGRHDARRAQGVALRDAPPSDLPETVQALWHDARGDWDRAHRIAQEIDDADGSWVHAYLHRKEGDLSNASLLVPAGRPGPPDAFRSRRSGSRSRDSCSGSDAPTQPAESSPAFRLRLGELRTTMGPPCRSGSRRGPRSAAPHGRRRPGRAHDPDYYHILGEALLRAGTGRGGDPQVCREAVERDPLNAEYRFGLGWALWRRAGRATRPSVPFASRSSVDPGTWGA